MDKGGSLAIDGAELILSPSARTISINSKEKEVILEAAGFEGWAARVPLKHEASIAPDWKKVLLDVRVGASNTEPVLMRFADGAKAALGPGAQCRFDLMRDQSYYLAGMGEVDTVSADGVERKLSPFVLPMTGGPLVRETDPDGKSRMKRLTPLITITFSGDLPGEIVLDHASAEVMQLTSGQTRTLKASAGQEIVLKNNASNTTFDWSVTKGLFRFHNAGLPCWDGYGLTDQAADMQWGATPTIDISNRTPTTTPVVTHLLTMLGRNLSAIVAPRSTFQYHQIEPCQTFAGSGIGDVRLYNSDLQQMTSLAQGNVLMKSGVPVTGAVSSRNPKLVLNWEINTPLEVRSQEGVSLVTPDSRKQITFSKTGGKIDVVYDNQGTVLFRSLVGDYSVQPKALSSWTFDVTEGDGVSFTLDRRTGVFVAKTGQENSSQVNVISETGFLPAMDPGATLTFVISREAPLFSRSEGNIIFFESAGSGASGFATAPVNFPAPLGRLPPPLFGVVSEFDVSRIPQPPVSIVK
ncbi:MAG: hypothetical protein AB1705_18840 [Verrucomicrobiota bacterium]